MGLGGVLGTAVAARAANARRPRVVLFTALLAIAVSLPLLALASSLPAAVALTLLSGGGSIVVEVMTDTGLQRSLDERVLGRAYGFALPAAHGALVEHADDARRSGGTDRKHGVGRGVSVAAR